MNPKACSSVDSHISKQKHFKCRWNGAALTAELPSELSDLLQKYLSQAHAVLHDADYPYVFSDRKGRFMEEASTITHYWESLLRRMGSPAIFPPHRYLYQKSISLHGLCCKMTCDLTYRSELQDYKLYAFTICESMYVTALCNEDLAYHKLYTLQNAAFYHHSSL